MVEPKQRIHLTNLQDDPIKMWNKLEEVHIAKQAGTHFNAYDDLLASERKRMSPLCL
jgi:hypothetical protein